MKFITKNPSSLVALTSATFFAVMAGIGQVAVASEPFEGEAVLCVLDNTNATQETKGNRGTTYTYNQVLLFRIDADDDDGGLMHGWEVLTSNTKSTASGGGYSWGEAVLTPDSYTGSATLEDTFKFPVKQSDNISGVYHGTGELEGVSVEYALTPAAPGSLSTTACEGMPWGECEAPACISFVGAGAGYFISGWVND
jgi:hypothetical protein